MMALFWTVVALCGMGYAMVMFGGNPEVTEYLHGPGYFVQGPPGPADGQCYGYEYVYVDPDCAAMVNDFYR